MKCPLQGKRLEKLVPYLKKIKNTDDCCRIDCELISCKRDIPVYLIFQVTFFLFKSFSIVPKL